MYNADNKSGFYAAVLFLIWPLLAVASAFNHYRSGWGKNILWAFVVFYGLVFSISTENSGSDIVRYVTEYQNLYHVEMTVSSAERYFEQSKEIDVARTLIAILLSRITDSQAILTMIYGLIFGFFFSRNMWFVLTRLKGKMKLITVLLFSCYFLIIPIWNMNGFRFWTAAHIFIYGLLPYFFEGKKKNIFYSASAVLVHFAFVVPVGVFFIYFLMGNRLLIYFIFFLTTFFFSQINLSAFNQLVDNYAPKIVQERTSSYRSEQKVEDFRAGAAESGRVWYAVWYDKALSWAVMGFLVILFFKGRDFFEKHKDWLSLFCFTLLFSGAVNLLSSLPSGGRYGSVAVMLALALIIMYIQNHKQEVVMERFVWAALPALLLFVVVSVRMGFYSMSATAVLGNPLIALFMNGNFISMNDLLKMFI